MNESVIKLVAGGLIGVCAIAVGGIVYLIANGHEPPQSLGNLASIIVAGLLGLLVVPRTFSGQPPADRNGGDRYQPIEPRR